MLPWGRTCTCMSAKGAPAVCSGGRLALARVFSKCLIICLLWSMMTVVNTEEALLGVLHPEDPNVTIGEPLDMFCILFANMSQEHSGQDAHDLYMTIYEKNASGQFVENRVPAQYTTVVSPTQLILKHYFLNESHHNRKVCCYLPPHLEIGCQVMYVGHGPFTPAISNVTVTNWEHMSWSWSTQRVNQIYSTTYMAWWRKSTDDVYHKCPEVHTEKERGQFTANLADFEPIADQYYVKVNASNLVGTATSTEVLVSVESTVAPGKVNNLKVLQKGGHSLKLGWDSPKQGHNIRYSISYTCKWTNESQVTNISASESTSLSIELTDLVPYTKYDVAVRGKPASGGHWGQVASVSGTTEQSAPTVAPPVTRGGYEMLDSISPTGARKVRLHWQPVPEQFRNGPITGYLIKYLDTAANWRTISVPPTDLSQDVAGLNSGHTFNFYTEAVAAMGSSGMSVGPISVPPADKVPKFPSNFTVIALNESVVYVSWHPEAHLQTVTVFWCLGLLPVCEGELQWREVEVSDRPVTIGQLEHGVYLYMFGLSGQTAEGSTGIHWGLCTHDITQVSPPPYVEIKKTAGSSVSLSVKTPSCTYGRGFIYAYRVFICPKATTRDQECSGKGSTRTFLVIDSDLYTVDGLRSQQHYRIEVTSMTAAGQSHSNTISAKTGRGGLSKNLKIVIGFVAFFALFCFTVGIISCFRSVRGAYYKCLHWLRQPVHRPQVYQVQLQTMSDTAGDDYQTMPNGITASGDDVYLGTRKTFLDSEKAEVGRTLPLISDQETSASPLLASGQSCDGDSRSPLLKPMPPSAGQGSAFLGQTSTVLPPLAESPTDQVSKSSRTMELDEDPEELMDPDDAYRRAELIHVPLCNPSSLDSADMPYSQTNIASLPSSPHPDPAGYSAAVNGSSGECHGNIPEYSQVTENAPSDDPTANDYAHRSRLVTESAGAVEAGRGTTVDSAGDYAKSVEPATGSTSGIAPMGVCSSGVDEEDGNDVEPVVHGYASAVKSLDSSSPLLTAKPVDGSYTKAKVSEQGKVDTARKEASYLPEGCSVPDNCHEHTQVKGSIDTDDIETALLKIPLLEGSGEAHHQKKDHSSAMESVLAPAVDPLVKHKSLGREGDDCGDSGAGENYCPTKLLPPIR